MTARNYSGAPPGIETVAAGGVTVIDLGTMRAIARHPVGVDPFGGQIRYLSGRPPLR
jgi:hypothetical protein